MRLGEKVDADLLSAGVQLTMGGEPTFVAIDDHQSPEWTVAALGPEKRVRADALVRRLRERFAPQGLLHYGLGKWYPGETMPRWAFSLYWRRDGKPLWRDAALVAREGETRTASADDAKRFAEAVAASLGIKAERVQPAYEDPAHWLIEEGKLPVNVDVLDPKLFDAAARARMVRAFEQGLGTPVAWVLPLRREGESLGERSLGAAARKAVPAARRSAGRLARAARLAAACRARRLSDRQSFGHDGPASPARPRTAAARRGRHRAHRARRRAARRAALRVHAVCRRA